MLYKVIYTDRFMSDQCGGKAIGFIVLIRPKYKEDKGIHAHELYHVGCFWENPLFHWAFYLLSKKVRLKEEVFAYGFQLILPPAINDLERYRRWYAKALATKYRLGISKEEAYKLLGGT